MSGNTVANRRRNKGKSPANRDQEEETVKTQAASIVPDIQSSAIQSTAIQSIGIQQLTPPTPASSSTVYDDDRHSDSSSLAATESLSTDVDVKGDAAPDRPKRNAFSWVWTLMEVTNEGRGAQCTLCKCDSISH